MIRSRGRLLAVSLIVIFWTYGTVSANCDIVKIAYAHNWLPIAYDEENRKEMGLGIAIQRVIFKHLQQEVTYVANLPWKRQLAMLEKGEIDAMASIFFNEERAAIYDYTLPYHTDLLHVYKHVDSTLEYKTMRDLIGYQGVAPLGASFGTKFDTFAQERLQINRVNGTFKILELLRRGRADFLILPRALTEYLIADKSAEKEVVRSGPAISENPIHMVFSRKSGCKRLVPAVDQMITQMKNDGTIDAIIEEQVQLSKKTQMIEIN